jgi:uncharacterized protein (TIGR03083 family)
MKKTELQERVRTAHTRLTSVLDPLTEEEAARAGLTPEWCIKDALAHITAWEIEGARILAEIQNGTWQPKRFDKQTIDDFNARVVEERRGRPLSELRAEFDTAHARMEETIAALPDEVDEKSPAYKFVEGVTFHHHEHHAEQIEKFSDK